MDKNRLCGSEYQKKQKTKNKKTESWGAMEACKNLVLVCHYKGHIFNNANSNINLYKAIQCYGFTLKIILVLAARMTVNHGVFHLSVTEHSISILFLF